MVTPENLSGETGAQREPKFDRDASTTAVDTAIVLLGAGVTAITHPLLCWIVVETGTRRHKHRSRASQTCLVSMQAMEELEHFQLPGIVYRFLQHGAVHYHAET
ncbi:unnamed protein product [Oncorhynchus mykiss]|uniref:Uncharacterized protein n=1 Tax=Oncorhynchus mykiss TaxID=8022 RepID=A0A060WSK9_ONCMY|nr:unnamed protein product [Oncorhynchus mykiss]